jgi:hypothetical protein
MYSPLSTADAQTGVTSRSPTGHLPDSDEGAALARTAGGATQAGAGVTR